MNIKRELFNGIRWTAIGKYGHYLFSLLTSAILARLLTPADFGIVSMVLVYTGFVDMFAEFGLSVTVIQKKHFDRKDLSTVFWLAAAIGSFLMGISIMFAPLIEMFFNFDGLRIVVQVMSIKILLVSLDTVPRGLLRRELAFKQLSIIEIVVNVVSGVLGVLLAFLGWGYWALVAQNVTNKLFQLMGMFFVTRFIPQLTINKGVIKDLLGFSGNVLGSNAINYWARNVDSLLIGRFLGSISLGFYNQAFKLTKYPADLLGRLITPSIQPVFASLQDEPDKIATFYLKIIELLALITFPLGVFSLLFAGPIIRILWGSQWEASIPIFEVLAVLAMLEPVVATAGPIFLARNRPDTLFKVVFAKSIFIIFGVIIGLNFNLIGVAVGYASAYTVLVFPLMMLFLAKTLEIHLKKVLIVFLKPGLVAVLMALILLAVKQLQLFSGDLGILFIAGLAALGVWLPALLLLYRTELEIIKIL